MIQLSEENLLEFLTIEFLTEVVEDIRFAQAECLRAAHNHLPDPKVQKLHERYEAVLSDLKKATEPVVQPEAEPASETPVSSPQESSESGDEAPTTV